MGALLIPARIAWSGVRLEKVGCMVAALGDKVDVRVLQPNATGQVRGNRQLRATPGRMDGIEPHAVEVKGVQPVQCAVGEVVKDLLLAVVHPAAPVGVVVMEEFRTDPGKGAAKRTEVVEDYVNIDGKPETAEGVLQRGKVPGRL